MKNFQLSLISISNYWEFKSMLPHRSKLEQKIWRYINFRKGLSIVILTSLVLTFLKSWTEGTQCWRSITRLVINEFNYILYILLFNMFVIYYLLYFSCLFITNFILTCFLSVLNAKLNIGVSLILQNILNQTW